jgi:hypothetical protein
MSTYIEIQTPSPADGASFLAQWYAGGECSRQAFALSNVGELLFLAFFADAPLIVRDDATRAMLRERDMHALSSVL